MSKALPQKAQAVIIGGGVVGASVAYHLAHLGWTDIVLLERKQLTCGTTWHAAGLMGSFRTSENLSWMVNYTRDLYTRIEEETGHATGFKQVGSISAATDNERFEEYRRGVDIARTFGVEAHLITPEELGSLYPLARTEDLVGGMYLPWDGQASPVDVTTSMAKGARMKGAKVVEGVKVTGIEKTHGRVSKVFTDQGDIETSVVVNCAGMWAREVGKMAGVNVPLHACEHFYVVTDKIPDLPKDLPVLREHSSSAYIKEDAGSLLIGAFEKHAKPWGMNGIPEDFCFDELPEDWDHFMPVLEGAMNRIPKMEELGIRKFFNGPESFTPDDQFQFGESPECGGFYVCAGFNSVGIQTGGGAGKALADWIAKGKQAFEIGAFDIRRMHPFQANKAYLRDRAAESLGLLYQHHFPYRQVETGRGVRRSPIHEQLKNANACFGEVNGWERPNWFAPEGVEPKYEYSFWRQNWFEYSAAEHKAVREHVAILDMSSFGKILVQGKDAEKALQYICTNDVAVENGRMVYTQWCNEWGGIEADVTVTRLDDEVFQVVTPAATVRRELNWLKKHTDPSLHVTFADVTTGGAVLAVMGPKSRELLQQVSPEDFSNEAFPFGTAKDIDVGYGVVRAARITYVGELGWELHVSADMAAHVFETLMAVDESLRPVMAGLHAMDSCRIEKGYRHYGHDIAETDTPLEAGLGFACKFDKGDFLGREFLLNQKENEKPLKKRMVQFLLNDPEPLLFHGEPILRNGETVGYLTSGNYGHHLGGAVGLGYVKNEEGVTIDFIKEGQWEILVSGVKVSATASLKPLYDPKNETIRC